MVAAVYSKTVAVVASQEASCPVSEAAVHSSAERPELQQFELRASPYGR